MNTQIYLMLVKDSGNWKNFYKKGPDKLKMVSAAAAAPGMLKKYVWGDSLDLPFPNFIRCTGVSHKIAFPGTTYRDPAAQKVKANEPASYELMADLQKKGTTGRHTYEFNRDLQRQMEFQNVPAPANPAPSTPDFNFNAIDDAYLNNFLKSKLPDHDDFSFTKNVCPATSVLAHACSSQRVFPFAGFFFRRKIGVGLGGIRFPFMVIGLTKVRIVGWELSADLTEHVSLKYEEIGWSTLQTAADTNLPTPTASKGWDTSTNEDRLYLGHLMQALSMGLSAIAGAATAVLGAAHDAGEERITEATQ